VIEDPFGLGPDLDKKVQETAFALDVAGLNVSYRTLASLVFRQRTAFGADLVDWTVINRDAGGVYYPSAATLKAIHRSAEVDRWSRRFWSLDDSFPVELARHSRKVQHDMIRRRDRQAEKTRRQMAVRFNRLADRYESPTGFIDAQALLTKLQAMIVANARIPEDGEH
jgi:hypothetical protein